MLRLLHPDEDQCGSPCILLLVGVVACQSVIIYTCMDQSMAPEHMEAVWAILQPHWGQAQWTSYNLLQGSGFVSLYQAQNKFTHIHFWNCNWRFSVPLFLQGEIQASLNNTWSPPERSIQISIYIVHFIPGHCSPPPPPPPAPHLWKILQRQRQLRAHINVQPNLVYPNNLVPNKMRSDRKTCGLLNHFK